MRLLICLVSTLFLAESVCAQTTGWSPFDSPTLEFLADGGHFVSYNDVGGKSAPGVLISSTAGDTWSTVTEGLPDREDLKPVYLYGPTAFATALDSGRLFRSDDAGLTWSDATEGLTTPRPDDNGNGRYLADVVRVGGQASGESRYLALTSYDAFRLGAAGWKRSSDGLPAYSEGAVRFLAFDAAASGETVVIASTYGLYRSADGGETWSEANHGFERGGLPLEAWKVHAAGGRFYALANYPDAFGGVYRSDDDGRTWTRRSVGLMMQGEAGDARGRVRGVQGIASAGSALYLATLGGAGLYRSVDGERWKPFGQGVPVGSSGERAVRSVWSAGEGGPVYALADTGDGQVTLVAEGVATGNAPRPPAAPLRLRLAGPNPIRSGPLRIEVTLGAPASLRLSVHDALGRRLVEVDAGSAASGAHVQTIRVPSLSPGLYTVLATSTAGRRSARESVPFTVTR